MDFFDKIFVINLEHRKDRWKKCTEQLIDIERFNAIKLPLNQIDKKYHNNLNSPHRNKPKYIIGAVGCKLSHLNIIKIAKERNYKNILILEDDFLLCKNFEEEFKKVLNEKVEWSMLYLGCSFSQYSKTINSKILRKANGVKTTHAYCLKNNIFDTIINDLENCGCEIDDYYCRLQMKEKVLICNPSLITQRDDYSDILHRKVNYKCIKFLK